MEKIDHTRKGRLMKIKENFHIYRYKQQNTLIDEQRTHENKHANNLYETALTSIHTPTQPHYSTNTTTETTQHSSCTLDELLNCA
jgi:hypothetical protein